MMISFKDFHKFIRKNIATSNIKFYRVLSFLSLSDVGVYLGDGPFSSDFGKVNLHSSKGTHWVAYINKNSFDNYGCSPAMVVMEMDFVSIPKTKYEI